MKPKMEFNTVSLGSLESTSAKRFFHLVGLGTDGKIAFRGKIKRLALKDAFEKLPAVSWAWKLA
jgi:transposase